MDEAAEINQEDDYILKQVIKRIKQIDKKQENLMTLPMKLIKENSDYLNAYENIISIKELGQKSGIVLLYLFLR